MIEMLPCQNFEKISCGRLIEKNSQLFLKELLFTIAIPKIIQTPAFISGAKNLLTDAEIY